jgi:hypothetical protein
VYRFPASNKKLEIADCASFENCRSLFDRRERKTQHPERQGTAYYIYEQGRSAFSFGCKYEDEIELNNKK